MTVTEITSKAEFEAATKGGDKLVVLDCYATWCGPCKTISPMLEKLSGDLPDVAFYKFDVDALQELTQELGVRAMPTFLFYKGGEKVNEVVGADLPAIKSTIEKC